MSAPTRRLIFAATIGIAFVNAWAKVLGFLRDRGLAVMFGAGPETDAFVVASTIPTLLFATVAGAVGAAFLPVFTAYRTDNRDQEAWSLASSLLNVMLVVAALFAGLGMAFAPRVVGLVAPGFDPATAALGARLALLMFPAVLFTGAYGLLVAVLHSFRNFIAPALGPVVLNITVIGAIYLAAPRWGITAAALGVLGGAVLQAAIVALALPRTGFRYRARVDWRHPGLARVFTLSLPIVAGGLTSQAYLVVDRILASGLTPGSIAALTFANKLVQLPLGLFALAIATVLYPSLSEHAGRREYPALAAMVQAGVRMVGLVTLPAAVGLIVLRYPIVRLLFQRGEFDARATHMTAVAVLCYGLGMCFHGANQVLVRGFHAMQDTLRPVLISVAGVAVNVTVAVALVGRWGHAGLAVANSVGALTGFLLLSGWLHSRLRAGPVRGVVHTFAQLAVASAVMGVAAAGAAGLARLLYGGRGAGLVEVGAGIGAGCAVYGAVVLFMGVEEVRALTAALWGRVVRRGAAQ